jgi:8-oxo-dGTP pyrophosphatase MutT (NUDIX family)
LNGLKGKGNMFQETTLRLLSMREPNLWQTLTSRTVYQSQWNRLRVDDVVRPDGRSGTYDILERPHGNHIIALNQADEVCLVGQYRYPTGQWSWELPGGNRNHDETPLSAAQRELQEETGFISEHWEFLGNNPLLCGTMDAKIETFVAYNISHTNDSRALEDGITKTIMVPALDLPELVTASYVTSSPSVVSIFLYCLSRGFVLH